MRYPALVLALAFVAVMITACEQKQADRPPQTSRISQLPEDQDPPGDQGSEGEQPPEVQHESETSGDSQGKDDDQDGKTQPNEESQPGDDNNEEPLLLLDDDEPLLLDDEGEESSRGPVADNSRCHHCHLNYQDEDLAVVHAEADIGCAKCHGNCDEHIADESWASGGNGTPPEIMYTRDKINPCCYECHPKDEIDDLEHRRFLAGTAKEKYCTDCHGEHRLTKRKCKWK